MGIAIFVALTLIVAAIVIYPLLSGQTAAEPVPAVTDGDIERALRRFRQARGQAGLQCPACGQHHQAGDSFCVRCGEKLAQSQSATDGSTCPSCGATAREGDQFCAKCGHAVSAKEVA